MFSFFFSIFFVLKNIFFNVFYTVKMWKYICYTVKKKCAAVIRWKARAMVWLEKRLATPIYASALYIEKLLYIYTHNLLCINIESVCVYELHVERSIFIHKCASFVLHNACIFFVALRWTLIAHCWNYGTNKFSLSLSLCLSLFLPPIHLARIVCLCAYKVTYGTTHASPTLCITWAVSEQNTHTFCF